MVLHNLQKHEGVRDKGLKCPLNNVRGGEGAARRMCFSADTCKSICIDPNNSASGSAQLLIKQLDKCWIYPNRKLYLI